jgi:hypothetical protein
MLVSLNVAINSYDYTLLSLLISNQFVEIKGCKSTHDYAKSSAVFKKFDKENLFQILCAGEHAMELELIGRHRRAISIEPNVNGHLAPEYSRDVRVRDSLLTKKLHQGERTAGFYSLGRRSA